MLKACWRKLPGESEPPGEESYSFHHSPFLLTHHFHCKFVNCGETPPYNSPRFLSRSTLRTSLATILLSFAYLAESVRNWKNQVSFSPSKSAYFSMHLQFKCSPAQKQIEDAIFNNSQLIIMFLL
jgi:hypothetical protein